MLAYMQKKRKDRRSLIDLISDRYDNIGINLSEIYGGPFRNRPTNQGLMFYSALKREKVSNPLIEYAASFVGKGGIYRFIEALGFTPNWQQMELVKAYDDNECRIACRAGKGPGKTRITSAIMLHWSMVHPDSALIVTAPTFRQCQGVWLAEAKAIINGSVADNRLSKIFDFTGKGFGILGAKPSDWGCQLITAVSKEAFQGLHRKYIAFLEEEASGVKEEISDAIKETISNAKGTWFHVRIGNPNSRMCRFFDSFHSESDKWYCMRWNTEETPETPYFSKRRNEEIAEEFGKDSDIYRISVLGEFPNVDPDCLINESDLNACCTQETLRNVIDNSEDLSRQFGIDLARMGGDENVVVARQGGIFFNMWHKKECEPVNAVEHAILLQDQYNWGDQDCTFVVDTSGLGESVSGILGSDQYMNKQVHEFYSQNCAFNGDKYCNKITEAWCEFNKLLKNRMVYLGERIDKKLMKQLVTRRYGVDLKTGRLKIESKDDYMKNNKDAEHGTIGKSPDRADALVMAFYQHAKETTRIAKG